MRWIQIVLDGVGCGDAPDATEYGDSGSNTLSNLSRVRKLIIPNLAKLGIGYCTNIDGVPPCETMGAWGVLTEQSAGKDSTTGHWELAGLITKTPFSYFYQGFPEEMLREIRRISGRGIIGNKAASGTKIIKELGAEHVRTGDLIVYTSADSVLQIAAHEEIVPLPELYRICRELRQLWMTGPFAVGRVIARPFLGKPGAFYRTPNRHDESLPPGGVTLLDTLQKHGVKTISVGKIADLFAGKGVSERIIAKSNDESMQGVLEWMDRNELGFLFANFVDFDMLFGHRNDPEGFANALERFDSQLPDILNRMGESDVLVITADHGNDPTTVSTDHSRERVPLLMTGKKIKKNISVGVRTTFADLAATAYEAYGFGKWETGISFWREVA